MNAHIMRFQNCLKTSLSSGSTMKVQIRVNPSVKKVFFAAYLIHPFYSSKCYEIASVVFDISGLKSSPLKS